MNHDTAVIQIFLSEVLGLSKKQSERDAELLSSALSPETINRFKTAVQEHDIRRSKDRLVRCPNCSFYNLRCDTENCLYIHPGCANWH